jgi:hypothetical protein
MDLVRPKDKAANLFKAEDDMVLSCDLARASGCPMMVIVSKACTD